MRYSQLAVLLTCLLKSLGEVDQLQASHFVELCAGDHLLHSGVKLSGLSSRAYDVAYSRKMNLLGQFGFLLAANYIPHLRASGVLWVGIPCSSWVFMSMGSTKRHFLRPQGQSHLKCTREGNALARRLCYLLELASRKKCFWVVEQPTSSLLFRYRPMRALLRRHKAIQVRTSLGAFGASTVKPVVLVGTAPWLSKLERKTTPVRRRQLKRIKEFLKIETVRVYIDHKGKKRCAGGKDLRSTQSYPGGLGLEVGRLIADHMGHIPARESEVVPDSGVSFQDFGDDTSDSGLESIL